MCVGRSRFSPWLRARGSQTQSLLGFTGQLLGLVASLVLVAAPALGRIIPRAQQLESSKSATSTYESLDAVNDPSSLYGRVERLIYTLELLPRSGRVERSIWTGNHWPLSAGGTAARPIGRQLSPMEKLDRVSSSAGRATAWELEQSRRFGHVRWAGHCNGLAAAGIMEPEPRRSVQYRGYVFSPDDVKALLVELWQGSGKIIGGRCERGRFDEDEHGRSIDPDCRDLNPATLHLALTNFVGRWQLPVIIDVGAALDVWNYPVTGYDTSIRELAHARDAARTVDPFWRGEAYPFNLGASRFVRVQTDVWLKGRAGQRLEYVLELDRSGMILGGEWIAAHKASHPDFIWRPDGERPENPHVDPAVVRAIAKVSAGVD